MLEKSLGQNSLNANKETKARIRSVSGEFTEKATKHRK